MNNGVHISNYKGKTIGYYGGKFLPFHKGHLNCIFRALKQVDILFVVVGYDNTYDKDLCEKTKFEWVSHRTRERWITKELKNFTNIRVLSHYERRSDNYIEDDLVMSSTQELIEKLGGNIDYVFSSEIEYESYFNKYFPNSKHIVLDADRKGVDISATRIREQGIYNSWEYLPKTVQEHYIKRVCICGIESTGKSILTKKLASQYSTNYVNEYGREFYEEIGGCFDIMQYNDFIKIVTGHNYLIEQGIEGSNKVLFIDTDNIYTQFFVQEEYGEKNKLISKIIDSGYDEIDLYLYIEPTLPHELDGLRQEKTRADKLRENKVLKKLYKDYGKDIKVINSPNDIEKIKDIIDELLH